MSACDSGSPDEVATEKERADLSSKAAAHRAYEAQTGRTLAGEGCFEWPESVVDVVVVGFFAHDYGCMSTGMFVDGEWAGDFTVATQRAFVGAGWTKMSAEERESFAASWVEDVVFAMGPRAMRFSSEAFELEHTPDFESVVARTEADGTTVVSLWVREPPGMMPQEDYRKHEYRFDGEANMESELVDDLTVSLEELR